MTRNHLSRRRFLKETAAGTAAVVAAGALTGPANARVRPNTLAALGGSRVRTRPFAPWPPVTADIEESLLAAFRSRRWGRTLQGAMQGGGLVAEFERRFAELLGAEYCLATGSCTQALHTALHAVGVGAGDEVLVPPCTFIASVQAILLCNALPVFVDVELETFQMDPAKMEPRINGRTRAVEPVHIAGLPCDMERVMAVADRHDLDVVEDAAQAPLAAIGGKACGTFGTLGCFSFQTSKVIACGEGGAIVGDDADLIERCYAFHNMGLSARFVSATGEGTVGIGTKYRMNEIEAALLLPQLATLDEQIRTRNENAAYLAARLEEIPGIAPQRLVSGATQGAYYLYGFRYLKEHFNDASRAVFLRALRGEGIPFTTMYFDRLNEQAFLENTLSSPTFRKVFSAERLRQYWEENHCPVNDRLAEEGVWLPQIIFLGGRQEMDDVADAIAKIHEHKDQLARL